MKEMLVQLQLVAKLLNLRSGMSNITISEHAWPQKLMHVRSYDENAYVSREKIADMVQQSKHAF
jgi:hypothetical protein